MTHTKPIQFAFLVHPLVRWHRRILGIRRFHLPLTLGQANVGIDGVGAIGRVTLTSSEGPVSGVIVAVPDTANRLATNQKRASALSRRAAEIARQHGSRAIGLGNALAVVAGRGSVLAEEVPVPITTGHACTAWTCAAITEKAMTAHQLQNQPIGILGFKGTVGEAVAAQLIANGHKVLVTVSGSAAKRAENMGCEVVSKPELLSSCPILVGASTTGPILDGSSLCQTQVLIDLALPPTLYPKTRPKGLRIYAGEPLQLPSPIKAGFWGRIWLLLAGYGRGCVYACFAEPLLGALKGKQYCHTGRRLTAEQTNAAGLALTELGFTPVLRRR